MTTAPDKKNCTHHYCRADTLGNGICCRCGDVMKLTFMGIAVELREDCPPGYIYFLNERYMVYNPNWKPRYVVRVGHEEPN